MTESFPERVERIMHEQNVGFHEAFAVAQIERGLERRRESV